MTPTQYVTPPETPADSPSAPRGKRPLLLRLAPYAVSIVLLAIVLPRLNWSQLAATLRAVDPFWFVLALAGFVANLLVQAYRWRICLENREKARFWGLFKHLLTSFVFNNIGLGFLGGDVYRTVRLANEHGAARSAFSVLLARVTNIAGAAMLPAVCVFWARDLFTQNWLFTLVLVCSLIAWPMAIVGMFFPKYRGAIHGFAQRRGWRKVAGAAISPIFGYRNLWALLLSSLAFQVIAVVTHLWLVYALGIDGVGFKELLIVAPPTMLLTSLPISVNGVGVREACYVLGLGYFGVSEPEALALSATTYSGHVLYTLAGGVVLLAERLRGRK